MLDTSSTYGELVSRVKSIHFECYELCKLAFGKYYPNAGNVGIFCQDEEEYSRLSKMSEGLTVPSDNPNQKYYRLREPIIMPAQGDVPEITYIHLYIRKPDPTPYGRHSGDVDFFTTPDQYFEIKQQLLNGVVINGAQIYNRPGWDMIQLSRPNISAVAYLSTKQMAEAVHVKFSAEG